jgi:rod shape-determining protein MreC
MIFFSRYSFWVGAMLLFALVLSLGARAGVLGPIESSVLRLTAPAERGLTEVFRPVASFLSNVRELNDLRDENRQLRVDNEALRNQITSLQADTEEIEQLREALEILESESSDVRVAGTIISQDRTAFTDVISINRGADAGIRVGNVAISPQGSLIGKVTHVFDTRANIQLVSDTRSKVNARIAETDADGIVQGSPDRSLEFKLGSGDINVGDTVVTSGLGGGFPAGLPIGEVSAVSGSDQDLFKDVEVQPRVRLSSLRTVLVITSFIPQRFDGTIQ